MTDIPASQIPLHEAEQRYAAAISDVIGVPVNIKLGTNQTRIAISAENIFDLDELAHKITDGQINIREDDGDLDETEDNDQNWAD